MQKTTSKAIMSIPKNGAKLWTNLFQSNSKADPANGINEGEYLTYAQAIFADGLKVLGGIAAGPVKEEYNCILFMVFDHKGNRVEGWPIDASDWEDFSVSEIEFESNGTNYILEIKETE